eukprot:12595-Pyramimonas_sp.AAC.1
MNCASSSTWPTRGIMLPSLSTTSRSSWPRIAQQSPLKFAQTKRTVPSSSWKASCGTRPRG